MSLNWNRILISGLAITILVTISGVSANPINETEEVVNRTPEETLESSELKPEVSSPPLQKAWFTLPSLSGSFNLFHGDESICDAADNYDIDDVSDLIDLKSKLNCVFRKGILPSKVPEGLYRGSVIEGFDKTYLNSAYNAVWKGKLVQQTTCNENLAFIGYNNLTDIPLVSFMADIGLISRFLKPSDWGLNDGGLALALDYRVDFKNLCPEMQTVANNVFPISRIVDIMRRVGVTSDGDQIYLGAAVFVTEGDLVQPIDSIDFFYFAALNSDPTVTFE